MRPNEEEMKYFDKTFTGEILCKLDTKTIKGNTTVKGKFDIKAHRIFVMCFIKMLSEKCKISEKDFDEDFNTLYEAFKGMIQDV